VGVSWRERAEGCLRWSGPGKVGLRSVRVVRAAEFDVHGFSFVVVVVAAV
jgi:hypothetical protein